MYSAVAAARLELAHPGECADDREPPFVSGCRRGAWTKKATGMAIDSYSGRASAGCPQEWMNEFFPHGARSVHFSISQFCVAFAVGLCHAWCQIMMSPYDSWSNAWGAHDFVFAAADISSCMPPELHAELKALPAWHPARLRAESFAALLPRKQL